MLRAQRQGMHNRKKTKSKQKETEKKAETTKTGVLSNKAVKEL